MGKKRKGKGEILSTHPPSTSMPTSTGPMDPFVLRADRAVAEQGDELRAARALELGDSASVSGISLSPERPAPKASRSQPLQEGFLELASPPKLKEDGGLDGPGIEGLQSREGAVEGQQKFSATPVPLEASVADREPARVT